MNRKHSTRAALLLTLLAPAALAQDEPVAVESAIDQVTVYADSARVRRTAAPITADGTYVFRGLTRALDPGNVRVRLEGGHVLGVEVVERREIESPVERVQLLREKLRGLEREQLAANDEGEVLELLEREITARLDAAPVKSEDGEASFPPLEAWQASHAWYGAKLAELLGARRELRWESEGLKGELDALRAELGRLESGREVLVRDVVVEADLTGASGTLSLEYFVGGCGWTPEYDLRTAGDARRVDLSYRARVHQETGEDWRDVALFLSTARPRRGAQGPEPVTRWVDLVGAQPVARRGLVTEMFLAEASVLPDAANVPATAGFAAVTWQPFADAQSQGLSVRFALPQRETLESRREPTTVLVGEASFTATPELYCIPELDRTVWLRGRATNESPWVLLPGRAAVFFGDDFIGHAALDAVQPGEELELHLGAVPGIAVDRVLVAQEHEDPGMFSSTAEELFRWRVRLEHHASPVTDADGAVSVLVREAIPRASDDRIEVEITKSSHRVSDEARWKKDREDLGIHTWLVRVPKGGATDLTWELTVSHPESKPVILD